MGIRVILKWEWAPLSLRLQPKLKIGLLSEEIDYPTLLVPHMDDNDGLG